MVLIAMRLLFTLSLALSASLTVPAGTRDSGTEPRDLRTELRDLGTSELRTPAQSASIHGRVIQPDVPSRTDARPTIGALSAGTHERVNRRVAVVFLDAVPRQAFEALPRRRARMDQRREQFVPRVLAITAGTIVDFPNNDQPFHNVMSLAPGNSFDLGRYRRGQSRSVTFDTPGIVPIICDIHAHMSAWVLVFSHPYFAVTDDQGRYTLNDLPPGNHVVRVWSELGSVEPRKVSLAAGSRVELDFRVGR